MIEDWQSAGFGLYLHWPFCQSKCPYCDFNSHVAQSINEAEWQAAYLSEIDRTAALTPGRTLRSVFIGGGTPSLMSPDLIAAILERIRDSWPRSNDIEVTLEANPGSVEAGRFRGYRDAGVNRVSMGIQALNDDDLRRLGRLHSVKEALSAYDIARETFSRVSFDLIYARQGQSLTDWQSELRQALSLSLDHLSLYQLTIEDGTVFAERHRRGKLPGLPKDDLSAEMYEATEALCEDFGFHGYEVSNYAQKGAESRHNLIYWHYGDYIGIGPGAHGRLSLDTRRIATEAYRQPGRWLAATRDAGDGTALSETLSAGDQATEFLLMGMRLSEGVEPARYAALAGKPLPQNQISDLGALGLITATPDRIAATPQGRLVLNAVLRQLLEDV